MSVYADAVLLRIRGLPLAPAGTLDAVLLRICCRCMQAMLVLIEGGREWARLN